MLIESDRESAESGLPGDPALYELDTLLNRAKAFHEDLAAIKAAQEAVSESDEESETDGLEDSDHSESE